MKNVCKSIVTLICICLLVVLNQVALAQDDLSQVKEAAGNWFERNWIWVTVGIVLLLIILFSSGRRKKITTTTTTTFRKDDGSVTKTTTVKND